MALLKSLLLPPDCYADDVADIVGNCVSRYGPAEWRAVLLTNEIHGHLGIYSTLGAKMGTWARDLFREMGMEGEISVLSFAGSVPPVSCLNDGLQVSTGATMGHGLFAVHPQEAPSVRARFTCCGRSLEIRLKPENEARLRSDIRTGVERYGHSADYWRYVRTLAVTYWRDWDRTSVFESHVTE